MNEFIYVFNAFKSFNYYLYMLYTCKAHLKICDSRLRGNKLINVKMLNVTIIPHQHPLTGVKCYNPATTSML